MADLIRLELVEIINQLLTDRTGLAKMVLKRVRKEVGETQNQRKAVEIDTEVSVAVCEETEMSSTGREVAKYGNDKMRKAEITKRLAKHPDFMNLINKAERTKRTVGRMSFFEALLKAKIKKQESMERLFFYDLEKE